MINLIGNALKYTMTGEVIVMVELFSVSKKTISLRFEVKDTGIGISMENKQKLFQLFSQLEQSNTSKYAGTGLGLSIAKHLVELMDGQIKVESQQGVGSTFWFTIQMERSKKQSPLSELPDDLFKSTQILLIEDSATVRNAVEYYLHPFNCTIDEICSADEAMELLNTMSEEPPDKTYDLIIVDYTLISIDGLTLASRMDNIPRMKDTPKILLSSQLFRRKSDRKKLNSIFKSLLIKPVKRIQLIRSIASVLDYQLSIDWEPAIEKSKGNRKINYRKELISGKRILVAEDNEANQLIIQSIIEKSECIFSSAFTGEEVLGQVLDNKFDLIFMDINMPIMNGYETTRKLREIGNTMPIIALTASALKEEINRCLDTGMNDVLSKPYTPQQIIDTIVAYTTGGSKADKSNNLANDNAIFKYQSLLDSLSGNTERVAKIISIFLQGLETKLENLSLSIQKHDFESITMDAHFIKGSSLSLTACTIGNYAEKLEEAAKSGSIEHVEDIFKKLREARQEFIYYLKTTGIKQLP